MNKSEIRATARAITELEVGDASDATVDLYIKDGYDRIIALERRWPFFEVSATITTVSGQRDYNLTTVGLGSWREITSILNPSKNRRLEWISYDQGEQAFIADASDGTNEPRFWSLWGGSLQLWPRPDGVYQLSLRGYRQANSWHLTDATEIDCDERFHRSLVYYTVAQLYQLQEDPELSSFYRQTFEEAVRLVRDDLMRAPSHQPLILSGGDPTWWAAY